MQRDVLTTQEGVRTYAIHDVGLRLTRPRVVKALKGTSSLIRSRVISRLTLGRGSRGVIDTEIVEIDKNRYS